MASGGAVQRHSPPVALHGLARSAIAHALCAGARHLRSDGADQAFGDLARRFHGHGVLGQHRLGREGKKSLEGSLAMFTVCFITGSTIFAHVRLREYPVFIGALVATLTELHEPLRINDNLTIPLLTSVAMQLAFHRIKMC